MPSLDARPKSLPLDHRFVAPVLQPPGDRHNLHLRLQGRTLLRSGAVVEVELSSFGTNDVVLDFLVGSGLWGVLAAMEPDGLRQDNGKPWRAINGVEVLRELARVERIAQCGKIVRDVRLMRIAGPNAEAVARARARGRPVVDPETLANPLGDWMHTLLLDRGSWGAGYLTGLHRRYGIDLVTRAQHDDLEIVHELDRLAARAGSSRTRASGNSPNRGPSTAPKAAGSTPRTPASPSPSCSTTATASRG